MPADFFLLSPQSSLLRIHLHQHLIDPLRVHINDLELKSTPLQFFTSYRNMFELMENESGKRIEFVFGFIEPFRFFEAG